jgi:hypothetical protein
MGARKKESERVTFMGGSKLAVDVELTLELSGMRDCGGVRERLDALERESSTAISILAIWWRICGVSGCFVIMVWRCSCSEWGLKHSVNPNPASTYTPQRLPVWVSDSHPQAKSHFYRARPQSSSIN